MKKRLRMLLAAALSCAIILPGGTFFTQSAIASEPAVGVWQKGRRLACAFCSGRGLYVC